MKDRIMAVILPDERWRRIEEVFSAALDLPDAEREAFVIRQCGGDRALAAEVEALLRNDVEADGEVADALAAGAADVVTDPLIGSQIGAWRVERQVGRGGMGAVYLVVRAHGGFQQYAALKVIKRGMDTAAVVVRMQRERRILASLNHPYIGKLLDGGATADGLPYFVMEHVEGLPIDVYCDTHELSIEQRCAVFQKVCEAVAYAHRSLVVHRDLKPSNILVTADGNPKLLDFGIAKVIRGEDGGADTVEANAAEIALTPEYASPEQVRGEPVNTASDVYSLAAVLYDLLTGRSPHRFTSRAATEITAAICREEPERPSVAAVRQGRRRAWSQRLAGDLDTIVLMGLRKEPERRYLSAGHLQADLARHFAGLPVEAREDTVWYRTGKFLKRNTLVMTAAVLLAMSVAAGLAATLWQARRADEQRRLAERRLTEAERARELSRQAATTAQDAQTRAERSHAEADLQRNRAEQRLADLLDLANRSLFDVHDEIAKLPGATETRKRIAASTLEYLDKLKEQAGGDPRMLLVLSQAYRRLGDVQGDPFSPSLGDTTAALASYREAMRLSERLLAMSPGDGSVVEWWYAAGRVSGILSISRITTHEAVAIWRRAQHLLEERMAAHPSSNLAVELASVHEKFSHQWAFTDPAGAMSHAVKEVELLEPAMHAQPSDDGPAEALGVAYTTRGRIYSNLGRLSEAASDYRKAIAVHENRARRHPRGSVERDLSISYTDLANLQFFSDRPNLGDPLASLDLYRKAAVPRQAAMAADPADLTARRDVAFLTMRMGCRMVAPGMAEERRAALQQSERIFDDLIAHDARNRDYRRQLAETMSCLGDYWRQAGDPAKALAACDKGDESLKVAGIDGPALRQGRALALAAAGRAGEAANVARAAAEQAERNAQDKAPSDPSKIWVVRSWLTAAEVFSNGQQACDAFHRAEAAWNLLPPANQAGFPLDRDRMMAREGVCSD